MCTFSNSLLTNGTGTLAGLKSSGVLCVGPRASAIFQHAAQSRCGHTLLELVISMGMGSMLVGGLAGVLYISSKTLAPDAPAVNDANRSSLALAQITSDLRLATRFTERTAQAVTFLVPDRNGDGVSETIRYSWSGVTTAPLLYQYNGGAAGILASNVQQFNLTALTRAIAETNVAAPVSNVVYHAFSEKATGNTDLLFIDIPAPANVSAGDLLIAAAAIDGPVTTTPTPSGWTLVDVRDSGTAVRLAVWWRIATSSEAPPYRFTWTSNQQAYGWIMRFSNVNASSPINAFGYATGNSATPTCPTVTTSVANAMILRIAGFDDDDITVDNPGLTGHESITMDKSNLTTTTTSASGGAGYQTLQAAGAAGTAAFALTSAEEWVAFTIAIAPDDGT